MITDIHGVSGREMLTAIIAGERDPKVLAQMARTRMRGKIRQLEEALDCSFFTEEHAFILQMMLANIDHLTAQINELSAKIDGAVRAVRAADRPAGRHPRLRDHHRPGHHRRDRGGHDRLPHRRAPVLLGPAGPQVSDSAGKRKGKNATGRGNPYIGGALGEAAANAGRTQTFLGAKYRRLVRHMPKKKAQGAISRTQLVITHALLSDPDAVYKTSAPTTTSSARTSAARSATTSAPSNAAATRSSSNPSTPASTPTSCPVTKASSGIST